MRGEGELGSLLPVFFRDQRAEVRDQGSGKSESKTFSTIEASTLKII